MRSCRLYAIMTKPETDDEILSFLPFDDRSSILWEGRFFAA